MRTQQAAGRKRGRLADFTDTELLAKRSARTQRQLVGQQSSRGHGAETDWKGLPEPLEGEEHFLFSPWLMDTLVTETVPLRECFLLVLFSCQDMLDSM